MPAPTTPMSRKHPLGPQVRVQVTAEQINTSTRSHSSHCMIAEAIKSAVPTAGRVAVDISTCRFSDLKKGFRYTYLTPRVAQEALVDFDEGLAPKPFSFTLRGAHVSRAGHPKSPNQGTKAQATKATRQGKVPTRAKLVGRHDRSITPRRVGGSPPPQLHIRREFGMRAFRAASLNRLKNEQPVQVEESE